MHIFNISNQQTNIISAFTVSANINNVMINTQNIMIALTESVFNQQASMFLLMMTSLLGLTAADGEIVSSGDKLGLLSKCS